MHHRILGAVILGVANFCSVVSTTTSLPPPSESLSASLSEDRARNFRGKRRQIHGEHKVLGVVTRARKVSSSESKRDRSLSGEMSKDDNNIFVRSGTSCHCGSPASGQRHGGILAGQKYRPCLCDRAETDGNETNASSDDEGSKVSENGKGKGKNDKKGSKASKSAKSKKSTGEKDCGDDSSDESKSSKSAKGKKHEGRGVDASQGNKTSGGSEVKGNIRRHKGLEDTKVDGMNVTRSSADHTKPGVFTSTNITSQALIANDIGNKRTSKASASGRRSTSKTFVAVSVSVSFLLIYVWNHRGRASQENEETTWQEQQQQHEHTNQEIQNNLHERNVEDEYLSDASYCDEMEVVIL